MNWFEVLLCTLVLFQVFHSQDLRARIKGLERENFDLRLRVTSLRSLCFEYREGGRTDRLDDLFDRHMDGPTQ